MIEFFGTLNYASSVASSDVSTHLPYIGSCFIRTVVNLVQCAPSVANIPFEWKGISLTIHGFPSANVGSTGPTNLIDTAVKQCSQISSAIDTRYKVLSRQNELLP
jgi:hypothetical protein